jgi:hypothetical protein
MDPVIQYILLMGITLIFTIIALSRDSITFSLLAAFTWFVASLGHLAIGQLDSPLTAALAMLYVGIGIVFIVSGMDKTLALLKENRARLEL